MLRWVDTTLHVDTAFIIEHLHNPINDTMSEAVSHNDVLSDEMGPYGEFQKSYIYSYMYNFIYRWSEL